jgi:hypothetical protein
MALSNSTCLQRAHGGIAVPDDFKDFYHDRLDAIFLNLLKPPKVIAPGAAAAASGRLREIMVNKVSGKLKMRLIGALLILKF